MIYQDSAKFWFPKLAAHPWQWMRDWLPKTVMIDYNEELLDSALRGQSSEEYDRLYHAVEAAIRYEISGPAFIRTDLTSAKHSGWSAYTVEGMDDLNHALLTTLAHAQLKSYHQKIKSSAIMVRPLLKLKHKRTAFHGLPVAKEFRVFADSKQTQCWHGYWPEEALTGHMDDGGEPPRPEGYQDSWIHTEALDAAFEAAKAMGGLKWSVDFAEAEDGKWWLLDMATAMNSYHHPECRFSGLDNFERV